MALPSNDLNDLLFHTFTEDDEGRVALRIKGLDTPDETDPVFTAWLARQTRFTYFV